MFARTHPGSALLRDQAGASATEFALLTPLLIFILFGTVELHRYMLHKRHIQAAASGIANLIAQRPDGYAATDTLSFEFDVVPHMFPEIYPTGSAPDWWNRLAFQITHVVFAPTVAGCTSSCTYTANVAWTWPADVRPVSRGALDRRCGALSGAATGATPAGGSLPANLFGPGSMTIVDLQYDYTPLLGTTLIPAKRIVGQGFASTRFSTPYIANLMSNVTRCAGY